MFCYLVVGSTDDHRSACQYKYLPTEMQNDDTKSSEWVPTATGALPAGYKKVAGGSSDGGINLSALLEAAKCTALIIEQPAKRPCIRPESPRNDAAAQYPTPKGKGVGKKTKIKIITK
ncbi:unnamed protein product [Chrysodeixis includens]|uniref:Uncharacterized protein n=1 Tax=Chrysodeixis includens TaxID=689277 RepID=A0A9P0FU12_CHRIL|nr:unnamed protein product [Chrysodeixis includens]